MAARGVSRFDPEQLGGERFRSEKQHRPVHGPRELFAPRPPAHALWDRELRQRRTDDAGDETLGLLAAEG